MASRKLGQILVDLGFIDEEQLDLLVEEQAQRTGVQIGAVAVEMNMISEDQLAQGLAEQMGIPVVNISDLTIPPEVLTHMTEPMARMYNAIPISFRNNTLTIATSHPERLEVLDELRNFLGYNIQATVTTKGEIDSALERYYASNEGDSVESIMSELANDQELLQQAMAEENGELDLASAEAMAESAPVRKLLNTVFLLGIKDIPELGLA